MSDEHENDAVAGNQRDAETYADALTEHGIDVSACNVSEKGIIFRQQAFLAAYAEAGVITSAARATNLSHVTVWRWRQGNVFEFNRRFEDARVRFCDSLETMALERVRAQKPNDSPLLLITLLNANIPEKFRQNTVVVDDRSKEILDKLSEGRKAKLALVKPEQAS